MALEKEDVIDALRIFKSYQDTANEAKFMSKTELEDEQITSPKANLRTVDQADNLRLNRRAEVNSRDWQD